MTLGVTMKSAVDRLNRASWNETAPRPWRSLRSPRTGPTGMIVRQATARRAREVAHPQLFESIILRTNLGHTSPMEVAPAEKRRRPGHPGKIQIGTLASGTMNWM